MRGSFPKTYQEVKGEHQSISDLSKQKASVQLFAVTSHDESVSRFKLLTHGGLEVYSVPYSLLPLFVLSENKVLKIITHDIQATLYGRNLDVIEEALSDGNLKWVKQSPGKDDGISQVFIERIEIQLNED